MQLYRLRESKGLNSLSGMVFNWKQIGGKQLLVHSTQIHVRTDILKVPKKLALGETFREQEQEQEQ